MFQGTNLNFSETPVRREQTSPGPTVVASGGDVSGLDTRVAALETDTALLDGRVTALEGQFAGLGNYANDAAAAAGGVAIGGLYRNGSILMIRVA